ncbi:putative polysaccharide biosynthesis protein [Fonticella tunisiensis]|uniref:Stage V sporulation protein B n=1 Tax=Fonticella tunisiensis TaxID=1096341 RepID=A0A4V3ETR1_9CLOT|nr:polysaccharide biosynthesis protein [Fonticella tunisiensis]TDT63465.1 stage V sporulation protein B [Fonticella tunisiensis]
MKKKSLVKGTLMLALSGIIAKFLGFFFRIPLIYMIGERGIGLYQLTYPLYTFLLALAAGIPTAISKMISERIALNKRKEAHNIFKIALFIMIIFGCLSSLGLMVFSREIIKVSKWPEDAYYSIIGISFAPIFTCILSVYRGYFQGLQEMAPPAASQIIEQIMRVAVGVGIAYLLLSTGIPEAAGGAAFGAAAGAVSGLLLMLICYRGNRIEYSAFEKSSPRRFLFGEILKIAIPVSIGQAIGSIMALIDSMIVPGLLMISGYSEYTATILFGQLTGKAHVLINVPLTLSVALAQNVVPAISSAYAVKDTIRLNRNVKIAFKFAMLLALPSCAGLYALAAPILSMIFQGMGDGWELMQILAIASIFIIIAQTATSVLNGIGKTVLPVLAMVIGSGIKVIINIVFIPFPQLNIKAAAYSTLVAYIFIAVLDIVFVIKSTDVCINLQELFIMPAICTVVMILSVLLIYGKMFDLTGSNNKSTFSAVLAGAAVYGIMLLITGNLSIKDIKNYIKR